MGVSLHFDYNRARKANVIIEELKEPRYACPPECSCNLGEDYCSHTAEMEEVTVGYKLTTPTGVEGYSSSPECFDCRNINQELKWWFLENVKGSRLSF